MLLRDPLPDLLLPLSAPPTYNIHDYVSHWRILRLTNTISPDEVFPVDLGVDELKSGWKDLFSFLLDHGDARERLEKKKKKIIING
jgi:hypothetical protein